jgi:predicted metal-dependent phosphoesterase TrpH
VIDAASAGLSSFVDLHTHSTASDGVLPPDRVVAAAHAAGISALALTDHDSVAGIPLATVTGLALGVRVVPGVELSAHDGDSEIHILALHVTRHGLLESRLEFFREGRQRRSVEIVERLRGLGLDVTVEMVMDEAGDAAVGRPHIARAMIRAGSARDFRDAFDRYLGAGRPAFVAKQRLEVGDAIAIAHEAGALAIWAHPGSDGRRARLEPLVELGLDGVEVRHPGHMVEDVNRLAALTDFFGLVPSGGSDWHGLTEGTRTIGSMRIPAAWLARQDALVAFRAQAVQS